MKKTGWQQMRKYFEKVLYDANQLLDFFLKKLKGNYKEYDRIYVTLHSQK